MSSSVLSGSVLSGSVLSGSVLPGPPGVYQRAGRSLVALSGVCDRSSLQELSHTVARAICAGTPEVVVDMGAVEFIDAAAIRVIIRADLFLRDRSRTLRVRSPSSCVERILGSFGQHALIENPAEGLPSCLTDEPGSRVAVLGFLPSTPIPELDAEQMGMSVSEMLRSVDISALA